MRDTSYSDPGAIIEYAQKTIRSGQRSLIKDLPDTIKSILKHDLWRSRTDKDGNEFKSFREFCEYRIIWGLGIEYDKLRTYCSVDEECTRLLNEIDPALASHGENQHSGGVDNVNSTQGGNDASYALRRLKRDHPQTDPWSSFTDSNRHLLTKSKTTGAGLVVFAFVQ